MRLARELHAVDRLSAFFDIAHQDHVISQVKLIAEPWDLGEGRCQVGNFPVGWTEWNAKYRDVVRRLWKGEGGLVSELATRLAGSSDLYEQSGDPVESGTLFVMLNAHHETLRFVLPKQAEGEFWERILDTSQSDWSRIVRLRDHSYPLRGRSVAVFHVAPRRRREDNQ